VGLCLGVVCQALEQLPKGQGGQVMVGSFFAAPLAPGLARPGGGAIDAEVVTAMA